VTDTPSTKVVQESAPDGTDVRRTIFDFGDAKIELISKDELCLIKVAGRYTHKIGDEIEKTAIRCRGNIGLVFEEIRRDPNSKNAMKFDIRIVRVLKSLRSRCEKKGYQFFICKPPPALIDALTLFGGSDQFHMVENVDEVSEAVPSTPSRPQAAGKSFRSQRRRRESERERERPTNVGPQIYKLDVSLERADQVEKELDSAAKCVKRFLPDKVPVAAGYEFAFSYKSCEKVGGDFFDFVPLDEQTLGISIGDVSGHGLDAALVMGITKKLINIRAKDRSRPSPATVLTQVNLDLHGDLNRKTFVTALYGTLDFDSGEFRFARAGHEHPILFRPGGSHRILEPKGIALGVGGAKIFSSIEDVAVRLMPGDCLLLVTDGLAECRNDKSALYSRDRLVFALSQADPRLSSQELLDELLVEIVKFANGAAQEDDMTAILIKRTEK
jgi:serine phosphatase RsbU (regulator of sigma subunit)